MHIHLLQCWYDTRGNDGSVLDIEYNNGVVQREIKETGETVFFGEPLKGEDLLQLFGQHTGTLKCPNVILLTLSSPYPMIKKISWLTMSKRKLMPPFLINKSLSYHQDSVFFTNEMNCRHGLDHRLQYVFFLNTLRKRQRFSKWSKPYISKKIDVVKRLLSDIN